MLAGDEQCQRVACLQQRLQVRVHSARREVIGERPCASTEEHGTRRTAHTSGTWLPWGTAPNAVGFLVGGDWCLR